MGIELVASGGTSTQLTEAGISHLDVSQVTGFPEMMDGRVKTLHPRIHGGILADRSKSSHVEALSEHKIDAIDIVVCNLYPFSSNPSIELIDVGGPTMVRAAAKNHKHVGIVTSPSQYEDVLKELQENGKLSDATRHALARAAFAHTATYDGEIVAWLDGGGEIGTAPSDIDAVVPQTLHISLERAETVRYGENPHQIGARYRVSGSTPWWDGVVQHAGTALSYLNLFDADAAWRLVHELQHDAPTKSAVAIIKHANASGAAVGDSLADAFNKALAADPQSAFGGIVAIAGNLDNELATLIASGPRLTSSLLQVSAMTQSRHLFQDEKQRDFLVLLLLNHLAYRFEPLETLHLCRMLTSYWCHRVSGSASLKISQPPSNLKTL